MQSTGLLSPHYACPMRFDLLVSAVTRLSAVPRGAMQSHFPTLDPVLTFTPLTTTSRGLALAPGTTSLRVPFLARVGDGAKLYMRGSEGRNTEQTRPANPAAPRVLSAYDVFAAVNVPRGSFGDGRTGLASWDRGQYRSEEYVERFV